MRGTVWSIGFRLVSFVCTQLTLRWVDPIALGKANIDLELALGFVLFLSREGYRLVLSKQWDEALAYNSRRWNVLLAILVWMAWLVYTFEIQKRESSILSIQDFIIAGTLYCFAAILEGWAEPYILRALFEMRLDHKVYAEGVATVTKTFVTVLLMGLFGSSYYPVSVFGIAQLAYAMAYYILLRVRVPMKRRNENMVSNSKVTSELRSQIRLFTMQGLFKHALTEGDRLILVILLSHTAKGSYDKGLYALASAYGSMVARLLFQPLEENARLLWSKQASEATFNTHPATDDDLASTQRLEEQQHQLYLSYTTLVKLVSYIGLTLAAFGSNYTDILLQLLGGSSRRAAAPVLGAYCVYTLAMAWNGMTEAFWYATASSRTHVAQLSVIHMMIGIMSYGVLAPQLVIRHGTIGLVMANIVAMLLRTIYAIRFATIYFTGSNGLLQKHGTISLVLAILPHPLILIAYLVSYILTKGSCQQFLQREEEFGLVGQQISMEWFRLAGYHVSVGVTCLIGVLSAVVLLERSYLQTLLTFFRKDHHVKIKTS